MSCWGLYVPEAYLSCQGGLSCPVGVYVYQKLTCPVRVVCHVLMGFICTRKLPVLSGWSVMPCWGLYVPETYLSCQGGLSCPVGVYMYRSLPVLSGWSVASCWGLYVQKLNCPVRVVCHAFLGFICT